MDAEPRTDEVTDAADSGVDDRGPAGVAEPGRSTDPVETGDEPTRPVEPTDEQLELVEPSAPVAVVEDQAEIARVREERARKRLRQTARDMIISMLVVAGVVVALVFPWNRTVPEPARVDVTPVVQGARQAEPWPVLAPANLPSTWYATNARISSASDGQDVVTLAFVTPTSTSVQLVQSATKEVAFVHDSTVGGQEVGSQDVAGQTWTRLETPDSSRRALVRTDGAATYVVTGTAPWDDLVTFTRGLVAG
jgi:hypothetical protein